MHVHVCTYLHVVRAYVFSMCVHVYIWGEHVCSVWVCVYKGNRCVHVWGAGKLSIWCCRHVYMHVWKTACMFRLCMFTYGRKELMSTYLFIFICVWERKSVCTSVCTFTWGGTMSVWRCACTFVMSMETKSWCWESQDPFLLLFLFSWGTVSQSDLDLQHAKSSWPASSRDAVSSFQGWNYGWIPIPSTYLDTGDPNTVPFHAEEVNALTAKISS